MSKKSKRQYKRAMELFHKDTHKKIIFAKWNDDGSAACITEDKRFINIDKNEIDLDYISYSESNRQSRERRKGQGW
ncbi:hypothetical protein DID75_05045 [Candidatus Marinamargulisbacteria bacterium SCGC AG-410-N11]|nr:hypothetical protein DID75_05045 [Candidatus Marinamargulisbacteria bacterium SCGC AG-410-N11]